MSRISEMGQIPISEASMRILRLLIGRPPRCIAELVEETGITRTAISEHVGELQAIGFLEQTTESPKGRGRPKHLYVVTEQATKKLFDEILSLVAITLWRFMHERLPQDVILEICEELAEEIASVFSLEVTSKEPPKRIREAAKVLDKYFCGVFDFKEEYEDRIKMEHRCCPFASLYNEQETACVLDNLIIEKLLGMEVERVVSRQENDGCCVFELTTERDA